MADRHTYEIPEDETIEIKRPEEIPHFADEDEEDAFWTTHYFGDAYVARVGLLPKELGPAARLRRMEVEQRGH